MDSAAPPVPADIAIFPNGQLGVAWSDGHESIYDGYALRCACPCAACVDEMTGRKILKDELVPRSVRPVLARCTCTHQDFLRSRGLLWGIRPISLTGTEQRYGSTRL